MTHQEFITSVKESIDRMEECGVTPTTIIVSSRIAQDFMQVHRVITAEPVGICFGIPLRVADLPESLLFYIESEVTE